MPRPCKPGRSYIIVSLNDRLEVEIVAELGFMVYQYRVAGHKGILDLYVGLDGENLISFPYRRNLVLRGDHKNVEDALQHRLSVSYKQNTFCLWIRRLQKLVL